MLRLRFFILTILAVTGFWMGISRAAAETIYMRYFESVDVALNSERYQLFSFTALESEQVTLVAYGLSDLVTPAITLLDPQGQVIAEDLNATGLHVAVVQVTAPQNGIYPVIVSRTSEQTGMVRLMLFEGEPLDSSITLLDTVDPFAPSRAYMIAGEKREANQPPSSLEFAIQSRPFDTEEELPLPEFYATRSDLITTPALEDRLRHDDNFYWVNEQSGTFYTVNVRPIPETFNEIEQQEIFTLGTAIETLSQPLLPYDILLTVIPGGEEPVRLERPQCEVALNFAGRTLVVQDQPGEVYRPIGQLSGEVVLEIIGTDDTGAWIQIAFAGIPSGSGWVQNRDFYDRNAAECVRVIPVSENPINEMVEQQTQQIITRYEVAVRPTPTLLPPTPLPTTTPAPIANNSLSMGVDNPTPSEGQIVTFSVSFFNGAAVALNNVTVEAGLATGLTFVAIENCPSANGLSCNLGSVPAGATISFNIRASINGGMTWNTLSASASSGNLSAGASVYVIPPPTPVPPPTSAPLPTATSSPVPSPVPLADLVITKTVDNPAPLAGTSVVFTIQLTNNGSDPTDNIVVNDVIPAGLTFNSAAPSQGSYTSASGDWAVGTLTVGAAATLQLIVTPPLGTENTSFTNTATVTSTSVTDPNLPNTASATINVQPNCVLDIFWVCPADEADLVAAINAANDEVNYPGANTINLISSTYLITAVRYSEAPGPGGTGNTGLPLITSTITLNGNGATIQKSVTPAVLRLMTLAATGNLTLNNLTLLNGNGDAGAGGIVTRGGNLTINNSTFSGNMSDDCGGAITTSIGGTIVISNSTFTNNRANCGGALSSQGGTMTLNNVTATNNQGGIGGAVNVSAPTTINGGSYSNNTVTVSNGGAINVNPGANLSITNATITGNTVPGTGGGIFGNGGNISVNNNVINGNTSPDCAGTTFTGANNGGGVGCP